MKKKSGKGLVAVLIVLAIALASVIGVVIYKQHEYKAETDFYTSIRSMR